MELAAAGHEHHRQTGHPYQGLIEVTAHCLMAGQACQQHCIELLGQGDREMAAVSVAAVCWSRRTCAAAL